MTTTPTKPTVRRKRAPRPLETIDWLEGPMRRLIRAAGRRVGDADEPELAALLALRDDLDAAIVDAVAGQRAHGVSWAGIGRGTGTTRQAAQQRWGGSAA